MAYELVVGLLVRDHELYAQYREEIKPLLSAAGGRFTFDFEIGHTLKNETSHEVNRLFVLVFPERAKKDEFFANPEYRVIRKRLYENAVGGTTIIAEYTR